MDKRFWQGFWRLADPKISLASFAGILLASTMVLADHPLAVGWLLMTIAGVFAVEIAKNASGELVDYDSGTDLAIDQQHRTPFSGGKRVLVDELLSRGQTRAIANTFYAIAIVIGLLIVLFRDQRVLLLGMAGMALAWFYHSAPLRLSYRGWGELAVAISYGPLVVGGTYLVQTGTLIAPVLHASLVLGLLVAAFLWINEFPDYQADKACAKNNLVVRMGLPAAAYAYLGLLLLAYGWLLLIALLGTSTHGLLWGLIGAPPALFSALRLLAGDGKHSAGLIPAQAACLASFVLMAAGAGIGYWLG